MSRMGRIVIAGQPHHVVRGGNHRQDVLFVDDDRRAYRGFLRERCERFRFNAGGYSLLAASLRRFFSTQGFRPPRGR